MAKITTFISYDHADADYANRLGTWFQEYALMRGALKPWIDSNSIPPGTNWRQEIENAIRSCQVFILIASEAHFSSYVAIEVGMAIGLKKRILPLYTDSKLWYPTILIICKACHFPKEMIRRKLCDLA